MRMKLGLAMVAVLGLVGCAAPVLETTVPFDAGEVAFINQRGAATIEGQAFMRQQGGGVVTCAGEEVDLIPVGRFSGQRMQGIYGSTDRGFRSIYAPLQLDTTSAEYQAYEAASRRATCDADGNFRFAGVANGDYFITTGVRWSAGGAPQGGVLMQRVSIRNGQSQRVLLNS